MEKLESVIQESISEALIKFPKVENSGSKNKKESKIVTPKNPQKKNHANQSSGKGRSSSGKVIKI